jgi:hypothetical protein
MRESQSHAAASPVYDWKPSPDSLPFHPVPGVDVGYVDRPSMMSLLSQLAPPHFLNKAFTWKRHNDGYLSPGGQFALQDQHVTKGRLKRAQAHTCFNSPRLTLRRGIQHQTSKHHVRAHNSRQQSAGTTARPCGPLFTLFPSLGARRGFLLLFLSARISHAYIWGCRR